MPNKVDFVAGELLVRFRPGSDLSRTKAKASLSINSVERGTLQVEIDRFGGSDLVPGLMVARVSARDTLVALRALRGMD